jgi:hypothetical protein
VLSCTTQAAPERALNLADWRYAGSRCPRACQWMSLWTEPGARSPGGPWPLDVELAVGTDTGARRSTYACCAAPRLRVPPQVTGRLIRLTSPAAGESIALLLSDLITNLTSSLTGLRLAPVRILNLDPVGAIRGVLGSC